MTLEEKKTRRETIANEIRYGAVPADMAKKYGLHPATIREIYQEAGVKTNRLMPLSEKKKRQADVVAAVRSGESIESVAKSFGLSDFYVDSLCRKSGMTTNKSPTECTKRYKEISKDVSSGMTIEDASKKYCLGKARIISICHYEGVRPPGYRTQEEITKNQEDAVNEIRNGAMIEDVASKHGFSPRSLWSCCQKRGVPTAGQWKCRKGTRKRSMNREETIQWALSKCIRQENGCLLWPGAHRNGYGRIRFEGKLVCLHRLLCEHYHGRKMVDGECALHRCDTPSCISESCLFIGTNLDNVADREAKGRNIVKHGEESGSSKLKEIQVIEIIRLLKSGERVRLLAERYGVSLDLIYRIKQNRLWKHISRD